MNRRFLSEEAIIRQGLWKHRAMVLGNVRVNPVRFPSIAWLALLFSFWAAEAASAADLIVIGDCERQESRWVGKNIFTFSEIAVRRTIQGEAKDRILVRQRGGDVGGIGQRISNRVLVRPGRMYLLLLRRAEGMEWVPTHRGVRLVEVGEDGSPVIGDRRLEEVMAELGDRE